MVTTLKIDLSSMLPAMVKLLQFCNIFTKDATTFTRHQRHEIIKYVRSRMPVFLSQMHQLLQNVNVVLCSLTTDERNDLVSYLVPEITYALEVLTASISEIKNSLEKVCKVSRGCRFEGFTEPNLNVCAGPQINARSRGSRIRRWCHRGDRFPRE